MRRLSMFNRCRLAALGLVLLAGCSPRQSAEARPSGAYETTTLRYQGTPNQVVFPELAEDLGYLAPLRLQYVGATISGPQDIQTVAMGDSDFGLAFNGSVLKLVASRAPVRAVVGGYGVDEQTFTSFFVLDQSAIRGARDLIGKKVGMNTLGAHSEFMLREYLQRQGLSADDAKKVTLIALPPVNTEQALRAGQVDVVALTSMFRDKALLRGVLRQLFSDFELFGTFTAGSYVMTRRFIDVHPRTVRKFVEGVARAIEWARSHPRDEVIARMVSIIEKRKHSRTENAETVKFWKSTGIAGTGGLIRERELQIWLDWLIRVGELRPGQLTLAGLYTNAFNPHASAPAQAQAGAPR